MKPLSVRLTRLIALSSSSPRCLAKKTVPLRPRPITRYSWYFQNRTAASVPRLLSVYTTSQDSLYTIPSVPATVFRKILCFFFMDFHFLVFWVVKIPNASCFALPQFCKTFVSRSFFCEKRLLTHVLDFGTLVFIILYNIIALSSSSPRCLAKKTVPLRPRPITRSSWYFPNRTAASVPRLLSVYTTSQDSLYTIPSVPATVFRKILCFFFIFKLPSDYII